MFTSGKWAVFLFWAGKTGIKIFLVDLSPPGLRTGIFSSPTLICPDAACHCWRNSARICCNRRWVTTLCNSTQLWMLGTPSPTSLCSLRLLNILGYWKRERPCRDVWMWLSKVYGRHGHPFCGMMHRYYAGRYRQKALPGGPCGSSGRWQVRFTLMLMNGLPVLAGSLQLCGTGKRWCWALSSDPACLRMRLRCHFPPSSSSSSPFSVQRTLAKVATVPDWPGSCPDLLIWCKHDE